MPADRAASAERPITKLQTIRGMEVRVYRDHNPPHFHIVGADGEVQVAIAGMTVMNGKLPAGMLRVAMGWATADRATIVAAWNALNPDKPTT